MRNREIPDSWIDISDYLDRDIRTCTRWEKELGYGCLEVFFSKEKTEKSRHISLKYIEIDRNFDNYRNEKRFKNLIQ